ncbi:MAG: hypothetical protein L0226_01700 [Acidobacteria bacterium]|nr:hypothetical protein [Acidobacteriota bacterium]
MTTLLVLVLSTRPDLALTTLLVLGLSTLADLVLIILLDLALLDLALILGDFFATVLIRLVAAFLTLNAFFTGLAVFTDFTLTNFFTDDLIRLDDDALVPRLETDFVLVALVATLSLLFVLVFGLLESNSLISASFKKRSFAYRAFRLLVAK